MSDSYGELAELESLKDHIDPSDVELLEAAGVPEHPEEDDGGPMKLYGLDTCRRGSPKEIYRQRDQDAMRFDSYGDTEER